jgi:hypothetical protein
MSGIPYWLRQVSTFRRNSSFSMPEFLQISSKFFHRNIPFVDSERFAYWARKPVSKWGTSRKLEL